jgi:hypothetical protein
VKVKVKVKVSIWHTRGVVCVWKDESNLDWSPSLKKIECGVLWGCCGFVGFLCDY